MATEEFMSAQEKVAILGDLLRQRNTWSGLSFEMVSQKTMPATQLLGEGYVFLLASEIHQRAIDFTYYPMDGFKDIFLITICDTSSGDSFDLMDWLKKHKKLGFADAFMLSCYSGGLIEKFRGFIEYIEHVFADEELSAILSGKRWESIPFDWAGMR